MELIPKRNAKLFCQSASLDTCILCLVFGFLASFIAIGIIDLPKKYLVVFIVAVVFISILLGLRNLRYVFNILLALFAFSLSLNLDVNFFFRANEAGAAGITFSLSTVLALILILFIFTISFPRFPQTRFCPILLLPTLLYMVTGIVSLLNAEQPLFVFFELFRFSMLLTICILMMNLKDDSQLKLVLHFLCLSVLLQGILAMIQYKTGRQLGLGLFGEGELIIQNIGYDAARATGTMVHPNILAYYFEILIPIIFALLLTVHDKLYRLFYFFVLAVGFAGILTTLSRAAWLALCISLSIVLINLYHKQFFRLKTALASFFLGILLLGPLYLAFPIIEKRFTHTDYGSASLRVPLNKAAFSLVEQFPVIGVGMNNFAEVFRQYDTTGGANALRGSKNVVHNLYLLVWAEVGTVGFLAFLAIFATVFFTIVRLAPHVSTQRKGILIGISGGLVAHLIHGFFDPGFKSALPTASLIYTLIGLVGYICIQNRIDTGQYHQHGNS